MKRKILFSLLVLAFMLVSCAKSPESAEEIMQRLLKKELLLPDAFIYTHNAEITSPGYLSPEDFGALYYEGNEIPEEYELIESYAIRISKGKAVNEIHIIKTRHKSENDTIMRMLRRRKSILISPEINPNSSAFLCEKAKECEIISRGNFVFLAAGEDISPVLEAIEDIC